MTRRSVKHRRASGHHHGKENKAEANEQRLLIQVELATVKKELEESSRLLQKATEDKEQMMSHWKKREATLLVSNRPNISSHCDTPVIFCNYFGLSPNVRLIPSGLSTVICNPS